MTEPNLTQILNKEKRYHANLITLLSAQVGKIKKELSEITVNKEKRLKANKITEISANVGNIKKIINDINIMIEKIKNISEKPPNEQIKIYNELVDSTNIQLDSLFNKLNIELQNKNSKDIYTELTTQIEGKDKCGDPSCTAIIEKLINELNENNNHADLLKKLREIMNYKLQTGGVKKHKKSTKSIKKHHNDVIFF